MKGGVPVADVIIILILLAILGGAALYIRKAKKSGVKCIGCPNGAKCGSACNGTCQGCQGGCAHDQL